MLILGIDTSGKNASAALYQDGVFLAQKSVITNLTHSQIIMPMVSEVLLDASKTLSDVDLFAAASGPGSYTGLRIGISAVKAFSFAQKKKCVGVSVLKALAVSANIRNGYIVSAVKARGNLVYAAVYCTENSNLIQIKDDCITDIEKIAEYVSTLDKEIALTGDSAESVLSMAKNPLAYVIPTYLRIPGAMGICLCAEHEQAVNPNELNAAYFEITKAEKELNEKSL